MASGTLTGWSLTWPRSVQKPKTGQSSLIAR
jgi:hypothetical protein